MAFGAELKDFADGFKIGRSVVEDSLDRKERKEERADAKAERDADREYRHGRDDISDSRYAEGIRTNQERYDKEDAHRSFREGVEDERSNLTRAETLERQTLMDKRAEDRDARDERRLQILENKAAYPEGQITIDPNAVPQGSGAIDDGTTGSVEKISSNYNPEWLEYANSGATRSQPLSSKLVSALDQVAPQLGVKVRVFSGGQDSDGPNRTGSHRHDHGNAGDIFLEKGGRQLSWENPRDRPIFEQFVKLSKQAGLTGFGAGDGYMQPGSMHVGFGNPGVWGAGGSGRKAPPWLVAAYGGDPGPTHGPGLAALTTHRRDTQTAAAGYAHGGLVKGFSLGGAAIDDGEDQYEPTPIPVAMLGGSDQPQQEQPQQVAEAIPTNVPTPTPRPEYGGDGVVTSQGNEPTPPDEKKTDDPYELGRRSVRDGLKRAIQQAGANDNGAINDPQSDEAHKKYLTGYGAAPRSLVQQAVQAVDPDKKMRPGERNLAALGQVYKHYMDAGEPEKAVNAASSMVQYYRQESNRFLALSQAAAVKGDLPNAAKAAVAAYTNIPNGRDLKITPKGENGAGGYEIKVTDEDGKVITTKVVNPQEFAAAAIGFNPATFDEEILNAAGVKPDKFDDISPDNRAKVDLDIKAGMAEIQDPKILQNPKMLSSVTNMAGDIASVTQNNIGAEQAVKLATSIAAADPKDLDVKNIRGNPDRVRVTVDGQTVVMTKNALADFKKTMDVTGAEAKTAADASAASSKKYKDAGAAFQKAREQFQLQADDNAATERGAAIGTAIGSMAGDGKPKPQTEAVPSFTSPSIGDPGTPKSNVPSWDDPAGGGVAIPDGGPSGDAKGLVEKGNIDLNARPKVPNPDGSVSTVRSITITDDTGKAILIPTVAPSGTVLSNEAAIELYKRTGQHLGVFDNEKDAETYAQALHQSQAARYAP